MNLKLNVIIMLSFLSCNKSIQAPPQSPVDIAYNDASIQYLNDRWQDTGTGKWNAFTGYIAFKCKNTSTIKINASVVDPGGSSLCFLTLALDNDPIASTAYYFTTLAETFTGSRSVTVPMINDGQWHTVLLKVSGYVLDNYNLTSNQTITGYQLDAGGSITTWNLGAKTIQCVGDSWMAATADWPRLMSTSLYKLSPLAIGGLLCSDMNTIYNNDYTGHPNTTDTAVDGIIFSSGVNDFTSGITVPAFQTSLLSLIDKIQIKQPSKKIFLIRVPKNLGTGDDFGKYGTAMSNAAGLRSNVIYIDTTSLDATVTWESDGYHLAIAGKQLLAAFVQAALISNGV